MNLYEELPVCGRCVWSRIEVERVGIGKNNSKLHMLDIECKASRKEGVNVQCRAKDASEDELHLQCANDRMIKKNVWQVK